MPARSFTRRSFLGLSGLSALTLLTACRVPQKSETPEASALSPDPPSGDIPAVPTPVNELISIGTPDHDPQALGFAQALGAYLDTQILDHQVAFSAAPDTVHQIAVTSDASTLPPGAASSRVSRFLAPVTNWRLPIRSITGAELTGLLRGTLTDWGQLGSPVTGAIERLDFAPAGPFNVPGVTASVPAVVSCADYETLVTALAAHPLGIAFVPLDAIDFRVQTLAIDDLDPLAGRGDLASYPLRQDLWLYLENSLASGVRDAANAFAITQGYLPDLVTAPGNPINLTVAGDIIFGRTVHTKMVQYNDFAHPLRLVAPRLRSADLTIADLECSMSDQTEKPTDPTTFFFTTNSAAVTGLDLAGIDGVSLANNHSMNFGRLGLTDTMTVLDQHGIRHFGGGVNLAEARQPGLFTVKGVRFAFLGYDGITGDSYGAGATTAGTCPLDTDLVVEDLALARQVADLVIPFFHWSEEYVAVPSPLMRRVAHLAIDHGATMVIGSHPHWVQGVEWYKGVPILYSLGNFVFDQEWSIETKQGMFTEIVMRDKRPARVRLVPVLIEDYNQPRILNLAEGMPILQRVYDATDTILAMG